MNIKHTLKIILFLVIMFLPNCSYAMIIETTPVKVIKVLDVGTIVVLLEGKEERIRLINIQRPEKIYSQQLTIAEQNAVDYAKEKLEGQTIYLEFDVSKYDRYRRMLAYIWLEIPSNDINLEIKDKLFNAQLLLNGHAKIETTAPNIKYIEPLLGYQAEAKRQRLGVWN